MIIAIDGVSGAGKSTMSNQLAKTLGFQFVSTGMFYRAISLNAIELGISPTEEDRVSDMLQNISVRIGKNYDGSNICFVNGYDVTSQLIDPQVNFHVSEYAQLPKVRKFVRNLQHTQSTLAPNSIFEGRDIGSVVFPDADLKIYLTCALEVRAQRRTEQLKEKGKQPVYKDVLQNLTKRDFEDRHRKLSPLVVCEDAIVVDTTNLTQDETLQKLCQIVEAKQTYEKICSRQLCLAKNSELKIETKKFQEKPMCKCTKVYTAKDFGL